MKVKQFGTFSRDKYFVIFVIRRANGQLEPVVTVWRDTRKEVAEVIMRFRKARRAIGKSSDAIFNYSYPMYSLRWIATHSGLVVTGKFAGAMKKTKFTNPCLRKITHYCE